MVMSLSLLLHRGHRSLALDEFKRIMSEGFPSREWVITSNRLSGSEKLCYLAKSDSVAIDFNGDLDHPFGVSVYDLSHKLTFRAGTAIQLRIKLRAFGQKLQELSEYKDE